VRFFETHEPFHDVMRRLYRILVGDDAGPDGRLQAAMLTAAIGGAVMHPLAVGLDDATLRAELRRLVWRFLGTEPPAET
jgi:hypothetical protein